MAGIGDLLGSGVDGGATSGIGGLSGTTQIDEQNHQAYFPGLGWLPIEPTGGGGWRVVFGSGATSDTGTKYNGGSSKPPKPNPTIPPAVYGSAESDDGKVYASIIDGFLVRETNPQPLNSSLVLTNKEGSWFAPIGDAIDASGALGPITLEAETQIKLPTFAVVTDPVVKFSISSQGDLNHLKVTAKGCGDVLTYSTTGGEGLFARDFNEYEDTSFLQEVNYTLNVSDITKPWGDFELTHSVFIYNVPKNTVLVQRTPGNPYAIDHIWVANSTDTVFELKTGTQYNLYVDPETVDNNQFAFLRIPETILIVATPSRDESGNPIVDFEWLIKDSESDGELLDEMPDSDDPIGVE